MKKIIALLSTLCIVTTFAGCSGDEKDNITSGGEEFRSGVVYTVGKDVDAGEYVVLADKYMETGGAFVIITEKNPIENPDSPWFNSLHNQEIHYNDYITISDGEYIYLQDAHLEPADTEIDKELADTLKIGKDIPAGHYDFNGFRDIYVRDGNDVVLNCSTKDEKMNVYLTDGMYVYRYDNEYECRSLD